MHFLIPYLLDPPDLSHLCADYIPSLLVFDGFLAHHFLPLLLLDVHKLDLLLEEAAIEFDALFLVSGPESLLVDILVEEIRFRRQVHILPELFDAVVLQALLIALDDLEEPGQVIFLLDDLSQIVLYGPFGMGIHHWHEVGFVIGIAGEGVKLLTGLRQGLLLLCLFKVLQELGPPDDPAFLGLVQTIGPLGFLGPRLFLSLSQVIDTKICRGWVLKGFCDII